MACGEEEEEVGVEFEECYEWVCFCVVSALVLFLAFTRTHTTRRQELVGWLEVLVVDSGLDVQYCRSVRSGRQADDKGRKKWWARSAREVNLCCGQNRGKYRRRRRGWARKKEQFN